jgi:hypothetical protein
MMNEPSFKKQEKERGTAVADYWPLLVLILVSAVVGLAIAWPGGLSLRTWMHGFMGVFLIVFGLLKLFHPAAFADGFEMYDLVAKHSRFYAYLYPLIEMGLGLAYLAFIQPLLTYSVTIVVMTVGTIGVLSALQRGLDINCPCMGSVLDVPLSTVTLTEDMGMGLMAVGMLGMA